MHFWICISKKRRTLGKMPCTSCMSEYSRNRKERACPSCRFGFCERCLNNKCSIPSISPMPISVCAACHDLLTKKNVVQKEKTRSFWDNGEEIPPSLRSLYPQQQNSRKMTAESKRENEWAELEARLQRLNEPIGTSTQNRSQNFERNNGKGMEELEERLAALKGVPLDLVKKPRLLLMNGEDDEEGDNLVLNDEATQLLRQAEDGFRIGHSQNFPPNNEGLPIQEESNGSNASSSSTHDSSAESLQIRKTINELTTAKSSSSDLSRAASELIYPNFAECIEKTLEDATMAEKEAMEFLQKHKQGGNGQREEDPMEMPNHSRSTPQAQIQNGLAENGQNK